MDPKAIIEKMERARTERDRFKPVFDDILRLTMPGRQRFERVMPDDAMSDVFDETGANATSEFVSRMQAGMMPPFTQFVRLEAASNVRARDREAVNKDLEEIGAYAFEHIWKSNFAQESTEGLYDLAISTGNMLVEDSGHSETALFHRSTPITEFLIERGPNDVVGGVFRVVEDVKAANVPPRYGSHFIEGTKIGRDAIREADRKVKLIEYTYRDFTKPGYAYHHCVVVVDDKELIVKRDLRGKGSNPFITYRWSTAAGETWGRGPLMNAIAAIRTTNLMVELVLENAAMSIVGMYQTDNDAIVNGDTISLLPGTIVPKEIGSNGLEPIQGPAGNFNMRDVVLNDQRLNIRKAMFNDMLSDPNKTPATATEVVERMSDLANRTSAGFSRMFYEFLTPYMDRVLFILQERGEIELPTMGGEGISYKAVSPLAQAQKMKDVQTLVQDFSVRSQMFGPQAAIAGYDTEFLHEWLKERMGLDDRLFASKEDFKGSMEATAEQMLQMQQIAAQRGGGGQQ